MTIIVAIFCLILGAGATFLLLLPALVKVEQDTSAQDEAIRQANFEMQSLIIKNKELKAQYDEKLEEYTQIIKNTEQQFATAEENAKAYYQKMMDASEKDYFECCNELERAYINLAQEQVKHFLEQQKNQQNKTEELNIAIQKEKSLLDELRDKTAAAVEANKRAAEMQDKENFYKLVLTQEDLDEISELRKILNHFRNPEPVNKVIWKAYYEKPYSDLIGRVVGTGIHCGIYKITNLQNGMCYVGQSTNISERWKQHIKRGLGADTPTRNKLYPIMSAVGVENFSFEIIEECEKDKLNEREDFWQEFFKAKEFGYSIK